MTHISSSKKSTITIIALLCFIPAFATPTNYTVPATVHSSNNSNNNNNNNSSSIATNQTVQNFNCPEDCICAIPTHAHTHFLHAKCTSIKGLKSDTPLNATLPIHSIDLSYLNLSRLSHALEKLRDVTSIDLSHNELHEIGHLGRRIKKLNLKHNRITSGKLTKMPQHVEHLNLQHNDITYLPLELTKLSNLQTLELSHNQINCSCETLEVRNWLQEHHVFMENPVKCSYPPEVKGKPWLQVRQSDICDKEKHGWYADQDENELMMGDQPVEDDATDNDEEEELGKAYMPIADKSPVPRSADLNDVEGSGDLSAMNLPIKLDGTTAHPAEGTTITTRHKLEATTTVPEVEEDEQDDEADDGSGSGGGMLFIPHLQHNSIITDEFESPDSKEQHHDDAYDNKPIEQPASETPLSPHIFGAGMGIFDDGDVHAEHSTEKPVEEAPVVAVEQTNLGTSGDVITDKPIEGEQSDPVKHAAVGEKDDSNATYFLLGVIALIVVGMMLFVGIKRCKHKSNAHDAENQRQTELLDMDKKNLGKPLHHNGHEHSPLIGEKTKSDLAKPVNGTKPYDANDVKDSPGQQQPLINGAKNGSAPSEIPEVIEPPHDSTAHEYYPITPRYPTPKSPRASKYAQYPQTTEHNNNNNNDNNVEDNYHPASPKSGRYSPVYSTETGRVKIKLTETPRPKTPMLVTRTKSNAGDIITTPVRPSDLETIGVHLAPMAVNGGANGHLEH